MHRAHSWFPPASRAPSSCRRSARDSRDAAGHASRRELVARRGSASAAPPPPHREASRSCRTLARDLSAHPQLETDARGRRCPARAAKKLPLTYFAFDSISPLFSGERGGAGSTRKPCGARAAVCGDRGLLVDGEGGAYHGGLQVARHDTRGTPPKDSKASMCSRTQVSTRWSKTSWQYICRLCPSVMRKSQHLRSTPCSGS